MRPCQVLRNGEKVSACVIRMGPKNSRVTFNGDAGCTELVPTSTIFEIGEMPVEASSPNPYLSLCTQAAELNAKMEAALKEAGVLAAEHMNLLERWEALQQLRDGTHVVVEGELWSQEMAEYAKSEAEQANDEVETTAG